jgi:hypothetical protein
MSDAKIEIKVGEVSFSGEGEGKWVSEQLDKVLARLQELANVAPAKPDEGSGAGTPGHKKIAGTLASFLTSKNAKSNKTRKFLAVALWLQDAQSLTRLATSNVTKALSDNNQGTVGNASQCLIQNVKQGFCEKEGKLFYVTPEGRTEIG